VVAREEQAEASAEIVTEVAVGASLAGRLSRAWHWLVDKSKALGRWIKLTVQRSWGKIGKVFKRGAEE